MSRTKSLVLATLGAAALTYGAHEYSARFSNENIFRGVQPEIERVHRIEARGGRDALARAAELRMQRYGALRAGISRLDNSSAEERCRYKTQFTGGLLSGNPRTLPEATAHEGYEPFSRCRASEQLKDPTTLTLGIGGISLFLIGFAGFIRSFFNRGVGMLGKEADKKRREMEKERRDALLAFGFPPADALSITSESIRAQSVNDVLFGTHTCASILRVLENYGFSGAEVQKIVLTFPGLLNRSPETITARLVELESGGEKPPEDVRTRVLRLPASLG